MDWRRDTYQPDDLETALDTVNNVFYGEAQANDIRPVLEDIYTYTLLTDNGQKEPELEEDENTLYIDRGGPKMVKNNLSRYKKKQENAGPGSTLKDYALFLPKMALFELPYQVGHKTEGVVSTDDSQTGETTDLGGKALRYPSYATYIGMEVDDHLVAPELLPDELTLPVLSAVAGGTYLGFIAKGRAHSKWERYVDSYLNELEEDAGDAQLKLYDTESGNEEALETVPALDADELENFDWDALEQD